MAAKLTKPQSEVLRAIAIKPSSFSDSYPPLKKLVALGFAEEQKGKWSSSYAITDLGRAALAEQGSAK